MILRQKSPSLAIGYDFRRRHRPLNICLFFFWGIKLGVIIEKVFYCALCTISKATAEVIYVLAQLKYSENESKNVKKNEKDKQADILHHPFVWEYA